MTEENTLALEKMKSASSSSINKDGQSSAILEGKSSVAWTVAESYVDLPKSLHKTIYQQPRLLWAVLIASGGGFLFGVDIGYIGPLPDFVSFQQTMNNDEPLSTGQSQLLIGTFSIGAVAGAVPLVSSTMLERIGRKWTIFIGFVVFLLGAIIQSVATNLDVFYGGRVVAGFSIGFLAVVVPIYQSEISPPHVRGAMVTLYQLSITFGILVANLCDWAVENSNHWWLAMVPQWVFAGVLIFLCLFIPESPRYLAMIGKHDEAEKCLNQIRKGAAQAAIDSEFKAMAKVIDHEAEIGVAGWREIFKDSWILKAALVGILLQIGQQFTGMNAFMFFGPTIFKSAGLDSIEFQVINSAVNFAATWPAVIMVDRYGRRILLIIGAIGMTTCLLIIGAVGVSTLQYPEHCFNDEFRGDNIVACATTKGFDFADCPPTQEAVDRTSFSDKCPIDTSVNPFVADYTPQECSCGANVAGYFQGVVIAFTLTFTAFFAATWGPVIWVICGEIYPNRFRAKIVGITTMANWIGNAGVAFATPPLLDGVQFYTFIFYGGCNFLLILFSFWMPETRDLPLEKIVKTMEGKLGPWKNKNENEVKTIEEA